MAQLGMVGLGRMGANIVRRLMRDGHECVVYDVNPESIKQLQGEGATGGATLEEFVSKLEKPRAVWVMIPAGITGRVVEQISELVEEGDIIIDGGNSNYRDDVRRARMLKEKGIHYVDVGTSGGVFGLERGYCLMVGGDDVAFKTIEPVLKTIAPGFGEVERTPGRAGDLAPEEQGYLHCGSSGAGHFVKMVHNGIEYGMMEGLAGRVSDSGEGRWTVKAAVDIGVPAPVLAASLFERFASRGEDKYANQVLSAMRQQFGGHKELPAGLELEAGAEKADKVEATPGSN